MATIHESILWLCWSLLTACHKPLKNPVHDMLFPTIEVMEEMLSKITFAADLIQTLLSPIPPSVDWIKGLPTQSNGLWGIYIILLEKLNSRPRIYIGSGTGLTKYGLATRLRDYTYRDRIPQYVGKAIDEGYTITHKGVLCWTTIPLAPGRFSMRSLMALLETTFGLVLWAMHSRTKTYGMPSLLSWALDDVQYDGCCGHVAISEMVWGENDGLTVDQIAAKSAEMDTRRKEQDKEARERYYLKRNAQDFEGWRQRRDKSRRKSNMKTKASGKWACEPCNANFQFRGALELHKTRAIHLTKVSGVEKNADDAKATKKYHCSTCNFFSVSPSKLAKHEKGPRHLQRMSDEAGL